MIIDCISDLHGHFPTLDGGDLLIIAGDLTARHTILELDQFNEWVREQDYKKKVLIAGNHDTFFERGIYNPSNSSDNAVFVDSSVDYLCDSGTEYEGLKIWGSAWTPRFLGMNPHCMAFTYYNEEWFYEEKIMRVPKDIDILITHGPHRGCLDKTTSGESAGSTAIEAYIKYINRPKIHVFGHIHESYGMQEKWVGTNDVMVKSINCSHVNEHYQPVNKPIRVIL